jgi:hypothetical protein
MGKETHDLIVAVLTCNKDPFGTTTGYRKATLREDMLLADVLNRLQPPMTVAGFLEFSFGKSKINDAFKMELCQAMWSADPEWELPVGEFDPAKAKGYQNKELYIPPNTRLKDPADAFLSLGPISNCKITEPRVAARKKVTLCAARRVKGAASAIATADSGLKAGDILLTHHPLDSDIAQMTCSWPTHAGIALSEKWSADANVGRNDGEAVKAIPMIDSSGEESFFAYQGSLRAEGGVAYRYTGSGKESEAKLEETRVAAAEWALKQTKMMYRFALKPSRILNTDRWGKPVLEKRFGPDGKALGEDGKPLKFYSKSQKKQVETPYHNIYCAELVWRAYHSAGVNIVDPKEMDLLASVQGLAAIIISELSKLTPEQYKQVKLTKHLPASAARWIVIKMIRGQVHNQLYFCAPWQLASSRLVRKLGQFEAVEAKYKEIKHDDYRHVDLHPYPLIRALNPRDEDLDEIKKEMIEDKVKELKEERENNFKDPLKSSIETKRLFDAETENLVTTEKSSSHDQEINEKIKELVIIDRITHINETLQSRISGIGDNPDEEDLQEMEELRQRARQDMEKAKKDKVSALERGGYDPDDIEKQVIDDKVNTLRSDREEVYKKLDPVSKKKLYDAETQRLITDAQNPYLSDEAIKRYPLEKYKKEHKVGELAVTVFKPWPDAQEEKAFPLRFEDTPFNAECNFGGNPPPFNNSADYDDT